jgi:ATP-dependent RNA helicase DDX27
MFRGGLYICERLPCSHEGKANPVCAQRPISVDDIIARRRLASHARKRKRENEDDVVAGNEDGEDDGTHEEESAGDEGEEDESGEDLVGFGPEDEGFEEDPLASSGEEEVTEGMSEDSNDGVSCGDRNAGSSSDESEQETQAERIRKAAYFDSEVNTTNSHGSFLTMNLSRPILKAVTTLGFQKPTPIQAATIPIALLGKDVVGGAVTGSGKTAAFIIPMLERLLYREKGKKAAATRCLVLVPTRELAVQCFEVGTKLAAYTDIRYCLIVGSCAPYLSSDVSLIAERRWTLSEVSGN